jgi:hypothetical protein
MWADIVVGKHPNQLAFICYWQMPEIPRMHLGIRFRQGISG